MSDKLKQSIEGSENIQAARDVNINVFHMDINVIKQQDNIHKNYRKTQSNLSPENQTIVIDEFLSVGELIDFRVSKKDEFLELLSTYSLDLPINLREDIFNSFVSSAWHTIVYQPFFAAKLIEIKSQLKTDLMPLVLFLCGIAQRKPIEPNKLIEFISSLYSENYSFTEGALKSHKILVAQVLLYCFYHQTDILEDDSVVGQLSRIAQNPDSYWSVYFIDLYYRHVCNHIHIGDKLESSVLTGYKNYLQNYPNNPLSRLSPFIISPYKCFHKYHRSEFINIIQEIALDCRTDYECRWALSSYMRVIQLYTSTDEEIVYIDLMTSIIEKFPMPLANNSHSTLFRYLHGLIVGFTFTKNINYLKKFEKKFIELRRILVPPEITHLQLEYASSLYLACHLIEIEVISELRFGYVIAKGNNPLDTLLFYNNYFIRKTDDTSQLSIHNKGSILKWLFSYINRLYNLHAKGIINENPLNVLNFKVTKDIYRLRRRMGRSISDHLPNLVDPSQHYQPSFYCRSARVFRFVPKHQQNLRLMEECIKKAIKADTYEIMMSAGDLMYTLFACYHYGEQTATSKKDLEIMADEIAKITEIGKGNPKIYWVYYAGLKYINSEVEKQFIEELWKILKCSSKKFTQLALRKNEKVQVTFPDHIIKIIKKYSGKGSLFAATASDELNNPELWNSFATIVFIHTSKDDIDTLNMISYFYSFAKCFARTRRDFDQKYCYNYIRCTALSYLASGLTPDDFYIRDTVFYLSKPTSTYFAFKEECTEPYFDLMAKHWDNIDMDMRHTVIESLFKKVKWARRELQNRNINKSE